VSAHLTPEVREVLTVDGAIASRDGIGGTARAAVDVQLRSLDARLARLEAAEVR
jgi:argininosuccinate lyase